MYHEDRLGGGGFARVVLAGASLRGPDEAERLRRQLEERIGIAGRSRSTSAPAPMRDRIAPSPELLDMLAPAVGVLLRDRVARRMPRPRRSRWRSAAHQLSTRPFYNERAVHAAARAAPRSCWSSLTVFNVIRIVHAVAAATPSCRRWSTATAPEARAADARGARASARASTRTSCAVVGRAARGGQRADRSADVLLDGVLQPDRGDAAARRHARRRCAVVRGRRDHESR